MNDKISQFYVGFGIEKFKSPTNDDVYINATNVTDIKELSTKILDAYKEKAKLKIKVGSEIIFLIPNEKYKAKIEEIIQKLKVNGKIEVIPPVPTVEPKQELKLEPTINKKNETIKEPTLETSATSIPQPNPTPELQEEKNPIYQPSNNVYKGTTNSNTYNSFKKPPKSNKTAIIIFIISLIFFIISLVLLFIM